MQIGQSAAPVAASSEPIRRGAGAGGRGHEEGAGGGRAGKMAPARLCPVPPRSRARRRTAPSACRPPPAAVPVAPAPGAACGAGRGRAWGRRAEELPPAAAPPSRNHPRASSRIALPKGEKTFKKRRSFHFTADNAADTDAATSRACFTGLSKTSLLVPAQGWRTDRSAPSGKERMPFLLFRSK